MPTHIKLVIERRPEVLRRFKISNTTFHNQIKSGVMFPPFPLGERAVGWLEHENDALIAARAAGKSDREIRKLVAEHVAVRKELSAA